MSISESSADDVRLQQHGLLPPTSPRTAFTALDSIQHPKSASSNYHHLADEGFMSDVTTNGQDWHPSVFAPPASLLNSRRPSFTPSLPEVPVDRSHKRHISHADMTEAQLAESSPTSPEDGDNFRRSLQIDMKGLVGDAVGNVSVIS